MEESRRKLGPYSLVRRIGRGAFGVVWLAEKVTPIATTSFALKLPRDEDIDLDLFKQEAAIWVKASGHPNVVALIEADTYDGQLVLVSEYVPDGSLATWLKQYDGRAPTNEAACEMAEGILAGLAHLHERHIIHRDLKPDNILLQSETPRLADFGIARLLRSGSYSSNISGTLAYMAPEAFDGKRNEQTDIWSVGVILYQLFGGRLPYLQTDTVSFIGAIMRSDPPPLDKSVPTPFRQVVMTALKRDPAERYQTAAAMRRDLRDAERRWWLSQSAENKPAVDLPITVAAIPTQKETVVPGVSSGSTIVAQYPQPVMGGGPNEVSAGRQLPLTSPRRSGIKVLLSVLGSGILIFLFLAVRILPHLLSSTDTTSGNPVTTPTTSTAIAENKDIRKWLEMASTTDGVDKVIEETTQEIAAHPNNLLAYRVRSGLYFWTYNNEKGKQDATTAEAIDPTTAVDFEARCYAKQLLKKSDEALADCNKAVELDSTYPWAWFSRGAVYYSKNKYDEAISDYTKGIELFPSSRAYVGRGVAFDDTEDYRRGLTDLNKAIQLDSHSYSAYSWRGYHYYRLKDYDRALGEYSEAIKLNPGVGEFYELRGNVYYVKKDYDDALSEYDKAVEHGQQTSTVYLYRGNSYVLTKQYDKAIDDLTKSISLNDKIASPYIGRGAAYDSKQEYASAIRDYDKAAELEPKNATVFCNRGRTRYEQQKYDDAIADLSYSISLNPRFVPAYRNRAEAYEAKGETDLAAADRQKAAELEQNP